MHANAIGRLVECGRTTRPLVIQVGHQVLLVCGRLAVPVTLQVFTFPRFGLVFDFLGHDSTKTPAPFETQATAGGSWTPQTNIDPCNKTTSPLGEAGCDGAVSIRYDPLRDNNKSLIDLAYYKEDDGTSGYNHHGTIWYKALEIPAASGNQIVAPPTNLSAVVNP